MHIDIDFYFLSAYTKLGLDFDTWLKKGKVGAMPYKQGSLVMDTEEASIKDEF